MYPSNILFTLSSIAGAALASPTTGGVTATELYHFPNTTWIENVAAVGDGRIILNTFANAQIYVFDTQASSPQPILVGKVPGVDQLTGISKIGPNKFALSGAVGSTTEVAFIEGTAVIATLELPCTPDESPELKIVAQIPNTKMLNGQAALPDSPHIILSADSIGGRIFRVNTKTGAVDVAFSDPLLGPGPNPQVFPLGANGLEILDGYLYFTNSNLQFFARIKIDRYGNRKGSVEQIYHLPAGSTTFFDDFAIARDGTAYVSTQFNSLTKISPNGVATVIVPPGTLDGPSSSVLSRDGKTLYVVTGGAVSGGGQVVKVKL